MSLMLLSLFTPLPPRDDAAIESFSPRAALPMIDAFITLRLF